MRFGTSNVKSLWGICSHAPVARGAAKYKSDLLAVQGGHRGEGWH
jgi:hypothetical protein